MKSTEQIIKELNELKDSLRSESDHPLKAEDALIRLIDCMVDVVKLIEDLVRGLSN